MGGYLCSVLAWLCPCAQAQATNPHRFAIVEQGVVENLRDPGHLALRIRIRYEGEGSLTIVNPNLEPPLRFISYAPWRLKSEDELSVVEGRLIINQLSSDSEPLTLDQPLDLWFATLSSGPVDLAWEMSLEPVQEEKRSPDGISYPAVPTGEAPVVVRGHFRADLTADQAEAFNAQRPALAK